MILSTGCRPDILPSEIPTNIEISRGLKGRWCEEGKWAASAGLQLSQRVLSFDLAYAHTHTHMHMAYAAASVEYLHTSQCTRSAIMCRKKLEQLLPQRKEKG